eukprot:361871-Chlamydomonas_euryale.AAC.22
MPGAASQAGRIPAGYWQRLSMYGTASFCGRLHTDAGHACVPVCGEGRSRRVWTPVPPHYFRSSPHHSLLQPEHAHASLAVGRQQRVAGAPPAQRRHKAALAAVSLFWEGVRHAGRVDRLVVHVDRVGLRPAGNKLVGDAEADKVSLIGVAIVHAHARRRRRIPQTQAAVGRRGQHLGAAEEAARMGWVRGVWGACMEECVARRPCCPHWVQGWTDGWTDGWGEGACVCDGLMQNLGAEVTAAGNVRVQRAACGVRYAVCGGQCAVCRTWCAADSVQSACAADSMQCWCPAGSVKYAVLVCGGQCAVCRVGVWRAVCSVQCWCVAGSVQCAVRGVQAAAICHEAAAGKDLRGNGEGEGGLAPAVSPHSTGFLGRGPSCYPIHTLLVEEPPVVPLPHTSCAL